MDPEEIDPQTGDTVIVVEGDDDTDTPDVEIGDTVVIVEPPADDNSGIELDPFTERFVTLENRLDKIEGELWQKADVRTVIDIAEDAAADALDSALEVDEEIVAAVDEAIVETVEGAELEDVDDDGDDELVVDEIAPTSAKVHWLFRPGRELFNRG